MKYISILGMAALAFGFVACDKIEDSTGMPQTNPELPTVTVDNIDLTPDTQAAQAINLQQLNADGSQIQLATIQTPADFPEGYQAEVLWFEIAADADFTKKATINATTDSEGNVTVSPDDWQAAQLEIFGKNPATVTTYVRMPAWAVKGTQQIRLKDKDAYFANFNTQVTPIDLFDGHVIEDAYYLVTSTDGYSFAQAIKFEHNDEYSPYDDPTFKVTVPSQPQAYEWVIIPESTYAAGSFVDAPESSYGVASAEESKGTLVANDTQDYGTPGKVTTVNVSVAISVDMEKLTYEVVPMVLYTPGQANGWDDLTATQQLLTSDLKTYTGFAHLDNIYKFATPSTWYGAGDGASTLSTASDAPNLTVDKNGLYWCSANIDGMSYSVTYIERLCVVGDASPAGWDPATTDPSVEFKPSADYLVWTLETTLGDGAVKFTANKDWAIQLGGSVDDLINDGGSANIDGPGKGKYLITIDFSSRPYTCTFTPQ